MRRHLVRFGHRNRADEIIFYVYGNLAVLLLHADRRKFREINALGHLELVGNGVCAEHPVRCVFYDAGRRLAVNRSCRTAIFVCVYTYLQDIIKKVNEHAGSAQEGRQILILIVRFNHHAYGIGGYVQRQSGFISILFHLSGDCRFNIEFHTVVHDFIHRINIRA